jgi:hypothetical protein
MKNILASLTLAFCSLYSYGATYCVTFVPAQVAGNTELTVKLKINGGPIILGSSDFTFSFPAALTITTFDNTTVNSLTSGYSINYLGTSTMGNLINVTVSKDAGALSVGATEIPIFKVLFTGTTPTPTFVIDDAFALINESGNPTSLGSGSCDIVLPIELQSFTANKKGTKSLLNWQVASEKNLNLYQLERSNDGVIFSNIFETKPKAFAINEKVSYDFTDETPLSGINYYRLKASDKNGEFKYSKVVSLDFGKILRGKAYPNPFDSDISVEMDISKNAGDVFVEIFDMVGKQVYLKKFAAETERMNVPIPTSDLKEGTYIIRVKNGVNIWQHKIVKN